MLSQACDIAAIPAATTFRLSSSAAGNIHDRSLAGVGVGHSAVRRVSFHEP
jgi:hypothetical protein